MASARLVEQSARSCCAERRTPCGVELPHVRRANGDRPRFAPPSTAIIRPFRAKTVVSVPERGAGDQNVVCPPEGGRPTLQPAVRRRADLPSSPTPTSISHPAAGSGTGSGPPERLVTVTVKSPLLLTQPKLRTERREAQPVGEVEPRAEKGVRFIYSPFPLPLSRKRAVSGSHLDADAGVLALMGHREHRDFSSGAEPAVDSMATTRFTVEQGGFSVSSAANPAVAATAAAEFLRRRARRTR